VSALYNEIDRYCCDWLQNLMDAGHITSGKIDDRSIADLSPDDVRGYERVHFFAGIGGWELALQMSEYAGPVWTGSCPCQPFSAAGKGKASGDERHLWPEWFRLISAVRPPIIFGEQVEAAIGWGWLDLVYSDLEAEGYSVGAAVLPACSVGAPHIRQRLWFVADTDKSRSQGHGEPSERSGECLAWSRLQEPSWFQFAASFLNGAHGFRNRVAKLRAAGNAITPQCAAEFIKASMT
jgi:DNA (cytosine-5)-methyltransferase 1